MEPASRARIPPLALRVLGALWLVFAGVLIAALAGELVLRVDHERSRRASERFRAKNVFFAHTDSLHAGQRKLWRKPWHKYEPNTRAELVAGGERFVVVINGMGYRTREFSPEKPPGVVRVLCIGGSTTVAGRTNDETYPALLEAKLRERWPGLPLEVLNLGVSGVNSEDWLGWLDKILAWDPDVIVQYEAVNDICWLHLTRYAARHPVLRRLHDSLLGQRLLGLDPADLEPDIRGTLRRFQEMHSRCRARGVDYLTATFAAPDESRASPDLRRHLDDNMVFWTRRYPLFDYRGYAAILARHNALFLELVDRERIDHVPVAERLSDPDLFIDICHLTPEGIDRLADVFLPAVARLVERRPGFRRWAQAREPAAKRPEP